MAVTLSAEGHAALVMLMQLRQAKNGTEGRMFRRVIRSCRKNWKPGSGYQGDEPVEVSAEDWKSVRRFLVDELYEGKVRMPTIFQGSPITEGAWNEGLGEVEEVSAAQVDQAEAKKD